MALTKLYQVVQLSVRGESLKVWRTFRTEKECEDYLNADDDLSDYMSTITLTVLPIWTNASESKIEEMLEE